MSDVTKVVDKINKDAKVNEAYFVGLCWSDPINNYGEYSDGLEGDEFIHDVWKFYYDFGKNMYKDGIKKFDNITVNKMAKEMNVSDEFNEFGGIKTINKVIDMVEDNKDNIEFYYETIKKNYVIRQLYMLFGKKVFKKSGKYDWYKMPREILVDYWNDKINQISLDNLGRSSFEVENLYIDADEFIERIQTDSADMLPYYNSYLLNTISQGVPRGHVTMLGGFGGTGKTSLLSEKFIMSCVANGEKTMVVLNEEDAQAFRQKIVLSILFHEFHTGIDRKRLVNGKLSDSDKDKIKQAFERMYELIDGDESLIKIIFMKNYVMKDLEKIVKYWSNRGYTNLVIDTHKISDNYKTNARWEAFVEDTKLIYKWTRPVAGGFNLRTLLTIQLADSTIRHRYLTFDSIGEGRKAKDEASIVHMFRPIWTDEYKGGNNELKCFKTKWNELIEEYETVEFKLEAGKTYYLLFTPKNRYGNDNDNGQPVLILEPRFNFNHFKEIGWTYVAKDFS